MTVLLTWTLPTLARAHAPSPDPSSSWSAEPLVLAALACSGCVYLLGAARLARRPRPPRHLGARAIAFGAGVLVLMLALLPPIDRWAADLASVHMVQHLLLMGVGVPLVVLGAPGHVLPHGVPRAARARLLRIRGGLRRLVPRDLHARVAVGWLAYATALWLWHVPALYDAALRRPWVHDLQHLSFVAAAAVFWRVVLHPAPARRLPAGPAAVALFTTSLHAMALGTLMTLAERAWYGGYAGRGAAWGLSAVEDQQVAGAIMWMPACLLYAVPAALLVARSLREPPAPVGADPT